MVARLRVARARSTPLAISGTPTTSGTQGTAFTSFTVSATGGMPSYSFSVAAGSLPAGLSLNSSTGVVYGTPSSYGTSAGIVIRVTDAAGRTADLASFTIVVSAGFSDGIASAPSGAANYPTYLDNNAGTNALGVAIPNRPAWNVAGVDYRVGPPSGQTFYDIENASDRAAHLPSNVSYVAWNEGAGSGGYLRIDSGGAAIVLDGWDLKGYGIFGANGATNITVKNCKFQAQSATSQDTAFIQYAPNVHNGTLLVQNCLIDGNYINRGNVAELIKGCDNTTVIEYCLFTNVAADCINAYSLYGSTSVTVRYNVMVNGGGNWLLHCDFFQIFNAASGSNTQIGDWSGIQVYGNLIVQQTANGSNIPSAMNSVVRLGDMDGKNVYNPIIHHNTILSIGTNHTFNNSGTQANNGCGFGTVWQWNSIGPAEINGNYIKNLECHDNYFFSDDSGRNATDRCINGYFYQGASPGISYTMSNNVRMWDGTTLPNTLP